MAIESQQAPAGVIARARITGGHATPAEGFAIDAARLEVLTAELLALADDDGWNADTAPADEP